MDERGDYARNVSAVSVGGVVRHAEIGSVVLVCAFNGVFGNQSSARVAIQHVVLSDAFVRRFGSVFIVSSRENLVFRVDARVYHGNDDGIAFKR